MKKPIAAAARMVRNKEESISLGLREDQDQQKILLLRKVVVRKIKRGSKSLIQQKSMASFTNVSLVID